VYEHVLKQCSGKFFNGGRVVKWGIIIRADAEKATYLETDVASDEMVCIDTDNTTVISTLS
jgi:hypothetical protein